HTLFPYTTLFRSRRSDQSETLLDKRVHITEGGNLFFLAVSLIDYFQQRTTLLNAAERNGLGQIQVRHCEVLMTRIGDNHGIVLRAQECRFEEVLVSAMDFPLRFE